MILLWGIEQDRPLMAVREALARRNLPVLFIDQMQVMSTSIDFTFGAELTGTVTTQAGTHNLAAITAAYVRSYSALDAPGIRHAGENSREWQHALAVDDTIMVWLDVTKARVINPLAAMASNNSKPYQMSLIRAGGFAVPDTIVTTSAAAVADFRARHGEIIYKSVSGVRSIVSRFTAAHEPRLADIRWCPTQFQQYIPGQDFRVHVVGEEIFTCAIKSDADDYRYAGRTGAAAVLSASHIPPDVAARCHGLAHGLGLIVAGIDLRRTPAGEFYCFEVNPSPAFSYYEEGTGHKISDAVAGLLAGSA